MNGIYEWVRNLVCYLIFMTMIRNLLPEQKYEKYLCLFAGMVFLLLILGPFVNVDGLEEQIAGGFERLTFRTEAGLLKQEIEQMGEMQMSRLTGAYQDTIADHVKQMAAENGCACQSVRTVIDMEPESESFGSLSEMEIRLLEERLEMPDTPAGQKTESGKVRALKKRIGEYYGLEECFITVIMEERQG